MKSETEPISDSDCLLRRVYHDKFRTEKTPILSPRAFEPRVSGIHPDLDGISLYREECLSDPIDIFEGLTDEQKENNGIVRISVNFLKLLRLSVHSKPVPPIPGHVVIPEPTADKFKSNKANISVQILRIVEEASREINIVRQPKVKKN